MKREELGKILRYYRKQRNLSVQDVALHLENENIKISTKTIYSWENGVNLPKMPTILLLCSLYQIPNIQQLLENTEGAPEQSAEKKIPVFLTEEEQEMLEQYQKHPEMHEAVKKLLE